MLNCNTSMTIHIILACTMCLLAACNNPTDTASPEAAGNSVSELPLKRGFYVASDTPCEQASNATLQLLRRDGVGGARDFCEFKQILEIAPPAVSGQRIVWRSSRRCRKR